MNKVAQLNASRPPANNSRVPRQWGNSVVDENASLGEEIRQQVAWIALAARGLDQDADPATAARDLNEALAWLLTISLEVDTLEGMYAYDRRRTRTAAAAAATQAHDAAAEE
jgi:hypothetical protein